MTTAFARDFHLENSEMTTLFAQAIGQELVLGDVILLNGPVGAGKTHFARALIQSRLSTFEDVPSPTFTIVQTYEAADVEIWHSDLYRIGSALELEELGLFDAFETAICLIEWPDRLGDNAPNHALNLKFAYGNKPHVRLVSAHWTHSKWSEKLSRAHA